MTWSSPRSLSVLALFGGLLACDAPAQDAPVTPELSSGVVLDAPSERSGEASAPGGIEERGPKDSPTVPVDLVPEEGGSESGQQVSPEEPGAPEGADEEVEEVEDPPTTEEAPEPESEVPELIFFAPKSDCSEAGDDEEIFACAEGQFWRVFQRDLSDRKAVWELHETLEKKLSSSPDSELHGRMVFQRAQLALALMLEQQDMLIFLSLQSDMERAIELDPDQPFYVTWLDTVKIAISDLVLFDMGLDSALEAGFENVKNVNAHTTASSLIASFSGTSIAMAMNTGAPMKTIELLETWDCHPDNLTTDPEQLCGVGELRPCIDWCLANSWKAPYGGPGLMYHLGEAYARVGDLEMAQELYELALSLPGATTWPHRYVVDEALWDMDLHVSKFTDIGPDQSASDLVYANSTYGCVFCHGAPSNGVVPTE